MESSTRPTLQQVFAWGTQGDLGKIKTHVPLDMLSKPDAMGMRLMHVAASKGHTNIIEWLVEDERRDTGVNKPDEDARGPLHWAAWYGHPETIKSLLEMGAIRDRPTRTGFTPLHYVRFLYLGPLHIGQRLTHGRCQPGLLFRKIRSGQGSS